MGRPRKPVDEVIAAGRKHLTKQEIKERKALEAIESASEASPAEISPPSYLPARLRGKFVLMAADLLERKLLGGSNADMLARYLIAEENYLATTQKMRAALSNSDYPTAATLSAMQDRFFKQCRGAASDLGLSLGGRVALRRKLSDAEEADELFGD